MRYYEGHGVAQEPVEAYQWLSLAAVQGIKDAAPICDVLKKILTAARRAEAKSRISTFISNKTAAATR